MTVAAPNSSAEDRFDHNSKQRWAAIALLSALLSAATVSCTNASRPARPQLSSSTPARESVRVVSVEPWTMPGARGRVTRTNTHRLFTTLPHSPLMDRLPVFLADALQAYRTEFVALPMPRIALDTYLVRDKVEWATLTMQVMGREAGAVTGLARGGVTTDAKALLYDIGPADTFAIAAHEGWHQFTQASFAEQLPAWLEEGLGTYFEGFRWAPGERAEFLGWCNPGRFDALKTAAIEGRLLPLGVLLESSPGKIAIGEFGEALTYYAQAWALVHFLREGEAGRYRPGLERIIADAAAGTLGSRLRAEANIQTAQNYGTRTPGSAAWAVYFGDVASAESSFHAFIESVVQPSGRRRIVEGRSPIDQ